MVKIENKWPRQSEHGYLKNGTLDVASDWHCLIDEHEPILQLKDIPSDTSPGRLSELWKLRLQINANQRRNLKRALADYHDANPLFTAFEAGSGEIPKVSKGYLKYFPYTSEVPVILDEEGEGGEGGDGDIEMRDAGDTSGETMSSSLKEIAEIAGKAVLASRLLVAQRQYAKEYLGAMRDAHLESLEKTGLQLSVHANTKPIPRHPSIPFKIKNTRGERAGVGRNGQGTGATTAAAAGGDPRLVMRQQQMQAQQLLKGQQAKEQKEKEQREREHREREQREKEQKEKEQQQQQSKPITPTGSSFKPLTLHKPPPLPKPTIHASVFDRSKPPAPPANEPPAPLPQPPKDFQPPTGPRHLLDRRPSEDSGRTAKGYHKNLSWKAPTTQSTPTASTPTTTTDPRLTSRPAATPTHPPPSATSYFPPVPHSAPPTTAPSPIPPSTPAPTAPPIDLSTLLGSALLGGAGSVDLDTLSTILARAKDQVDAIRSSTGGALSTPQGVASSIPTPGGLQTPASTPAPTSSAPGLIGAGALGRTDPRLMADPRLAYRAQMQRESPEKRD